MKKKVRGNNIRNTNYNNPTIQLAGKTSEKQLTRENARNTNHKEQYKNKTYREHYKQKQLTRKNVRNTNHKEQRKNKTYRNDTRNNNYKKQYKITANWNN